jgi:Bacterial SH3 domain
VVLRGPWLRPGRCAGALLLAAAVGCSTPAPTTPAEVLPGSTAASPVELRPDPEPGRVTLAVTVRNTSGQSLPTADPQPGYVYRAGQTYLSPDLAPRAGAWRVAVGPASLSADQLPYRWGLGGPLPPGASRLVTGSLILPAGAPPGRFVAVLLQDAPPVDHFGARWGLIDDRATGWVTVLVDEAEVRSAPSPSAAVVAQARYATRLAVVRRLDQWLQVRLPSGQEGWLPTACVASAAS